MSGPDRMIPKKQVDELIAAVFPLMKLGDRDPLSHFSVPVGAGTTAVVTFDGPVDPAAVDALIAQLGIIKSFAAGRPEPFTKESVKRMLDDAVARIFEMRSAP